MLQRHVNLLDFYCSEYGRELSNQQLYKELEESFFHSVTDETKTLYQKLLLDHPERLRRVTQDIPHMVKLEDRKQRLEKYEDSIQRLLNDVVNGVLKKTNLKPTDIDFIVVTSSAGKTMPSAASIVANNFNFPSKTVTLNLGDMACSSGLAALDCGRRFLLSERKPSRCLVVALEAVTTMLNQSYQAVVPNVVFGEGAAAIILTTHKEKAKYFLKHSVRTITAEQRAFDVIRFVENENGPYIHLSREVPVVAGGAIGDNLKQFVPGILSVKDKIFYLLNKRIPKWQKNLDYWALHPGGTAVIKGLTKKLKLALGDTAFSQRVFEKRSNMSSPSVFYVLNEIEKQGITRRAKVLAMSFGSGFKVNSMLLKRLTPAKRIQESVLRVVREENQLNCTLSLNSASEKTKELYFHFDLKPFEPKQITKKLWEASLGIDRIELAPNVLNTLKPCDRILFSNASKDLLLPKGQLIINEALEHDRPKKTMHKNAPPLYPVIGAQPPQYSSVAKKKLFNST